MKIAGLILAAGGSSRMKESKQLLPWGEHSLLENVIQTAQNSKLDALYLVLGAASEKIKEQINLTGLQVVENKQWKDGLGTSIANGVDFLSKDMAVDGCLILLADQPFISPEYINKMIDAYTVDVITASDYNGKAGVPCLFPRRFFPQLVSLSGDRGAGKLLNALEAKVECLKAPVDLRDIDTPEAYQKFLPK